MTKVWPEPMAETRAQRLRADLAERGMARATVLSESMAPALRRGDLVRVVAPKTVRRGDIAVVEVGPALVIHRVLRVSSTTIVCCGDQRRRHDPPVSPAQVCGIAVAVEGRGTLAGGLWGLVSARCGFWIRVVRSLGSRLSADLDLLRIQRVCCEPRVHLTEDGPRDTMYPASIRLTPEAALEALSLPDQRTCGARRPDADAAAGAGYVEVIELPVGVYGNLPLAERRRLLGAFRGHRVVVWGRPLESPRLRLMAWVRRVLIALGRPSGQPGDTALADSAHGWHLMHAFTPQALAEEVREAGGVVEEAEVVSVPLGRYIRVSATLPPHGA